MSQSYNSMENFYKHKNNRLTLWRHSMGTTGWIKARRSESRPAEYSEEALTVLVESSIKHMVPFLKDS